MDRNLELLKTIHYELAKELLDKIKSGDKFFTKYRYLDLKNRRVTFVKSDKKIYNKKN